jgi:hypothetical protein
MERRRGTFTLWLLAAGAFALVGCRTPTGSEESSSWFNFSSRRGGQGGGSTGAAKPGKKPAAVTTERTAEVPPGPKPATAKNAEPAKAMAPAESQPAPLDPPKAAKPAGAPPPVAATDGPDARRLAVRIDAGSTPEPRRPASALGLRSPPGADPTLRAHPPLEIAVPDLARAHDTPAKSLPIEAGQGTKRSPTDMALPLSVPGATTGRRPPNASLRLPGFGETEPTTSGRPRLTLPEVGEVSAQREARDVLRLPSGEAPDAREGVAPKLTLASPPEPSRSRAADATSLPGLAALAPLGEERTGRSISGIDGRAEKARTMPSASGLPLPSPTAGPTRGVAKGTSPALPNVAAPDQSRDPAERLRIAIGEGESTAEASGRGPSGSAGQPAVAPDRPLAASRSLPPFAPATGPTAAGGRTLRATAPEAPPTAATVPLPFRLSAWISDEETHRRWREQQLDRAGAEEKARQAEQERLRQALLRFLIPTAPTK